MKPECIGYWLYDNTCRNIYRDGYVGITTAGLANRVKGHRKYNKRLPKQFEARIVFEGTITECARWETKLRPRPLIGWNIARGGLEFGVAMAGVPKSRRWRAWMRKIAKARFTDPAECERLSKAVIAGMKASGHDNAGPNNGRYGKPMSARGKAKTRATIAANGGRAGKNNANYGKRWPDRRRNTLSKKMKGRDCCTAAQARRRKAHTPRGRHHPAFGKPQSEATKQKNREAQLAHDWSGARNGFYGRKHTAETKAILSAKAKARETSKKHAK